MASSISERVRRISVSVNGVGGMISFCLGRECQWVRRLWETNERRAERVGEETERGKGVREGKKPTLIIDGSRLYDPVVSTSKDVNRSWFLSLHQNTQEVTSNQLQYVNEKV